MSNQNTAYEYRINPKNNRVVQVREYMLNDRNNLMWRTYMRCVSAERARLVLAMLGGIDQDVEAVTE